MQKLLLFLNNKILNNKKFRLMTLKCFFMHFRLKFYVNFVGVHPHVALSATRGKDSPSLKEVFQPCFLAALQPCLLADFKEQMFPFIFSFFKCL